MARSSTQTHSTTKAKTLTLITVAAAGVAAYAVATLSTENFNAERTNQDICIAQCSGVSACINACLAPVQADVYVLTLGSAIPQALPPTRVGDTYRQRLVVDKYAQEQGDWLVTSGALPAGLTLDPMGLLSGTPTNKTKATFSVTMLLPGIDGVRPDIEEVLNLSLTVSSSPTAATSAETVATAQAVPVSITTPLGGILVNRDQPYELRLASQGIPDTALWSVSYGTLPDGLRLTEDGVIIGTPTKEQRLSFGVSVRSKADSALFAAVDGKITVVSSAAPTGIDTVAADAGTNTNTNTNTATSADAAFSPESSALTAGTVGTYASFPFSLNDGVDRTWSIDRIPEGMKFHALTRVLQGTPLTPGIFPFTVTATKGTDVKSKSYTWSVAGDVRPLEITTASLPEGQVSVAYQAQLAAQGGSGGYKWALTGTRPTGWSLSEAGALVNASPKEGVFTFMVRLTDATANLTKEAQLTVNIRQGAAQANTNTNTNTNTGAGANTNTNTVADADRVTAGEPVRITTETLEGVAGVQFDTILRATGGNGNYRWTSTSPNLPPGWDLYSSGQLRAAAPTQGTYTFSVKATDLLLATSFATKNVVVTIRPAGTPVTNTNTNTNANSTPNTTALAFRDVGSYPDGFIGFGYNSRPFDVVGGTGTYRFNVASGALPDGLTMNASGYVIGTPTRAGTFSFTTALTDGTNTVRANRVIVVRTAAERTIINTTGSGTTSSVGLDTRLAALNRMGVRVHDLVKLQDDGNLSTQEDTTVYYVGSDGRRHAFPNPNVYFSWFNDFGGVRIIGSTDLANLPLGANITYRPGVRLVKFVTDPKVYVVDLGRRLRAIRSEADAAAIYGSNWANNVDDISDAFYMDYRIDNVIDTPSAIRPSQLTSSVIWPSDVLPL